MADIDELIERVEKGEGADRELDLAIITTVYPFALVLRHNRETGENEPYTFHDPTVSVDSVLVLIEEKLPGWVVAVVGQSDDRSWWAELRRGHLTSYDKVALSRLKCSGPARALLAAFLKAHKEQHDGR